VTPLEFIARWKNSGGAELANSQMFLLELCDLLVLEHPDSGKSDTTNEQYVF